MPTEDNEMLPTPVAAALGLVPTVLDGVRKLPAKAATLPVLGVSTALTALERARTGYDELADRGERWVSQWRGEDEPAAVLHRVEGAVTETVLETVEAVAEQVDPPEATSQDDLPLPDYDHMTLGSLRGRLRSLSVEELVQVRDYEKAHAHRLPVVTLLDNRIAKLATNTVGDESS